MAAGDVIGWTEHGGAAGKETSCGQSEFNAKGGSPIGKT
jgi:hypothetical protein